MRLVELKEYDENSMQLALPVYDSMRRILLNAGNRIHPKYLKRLEQLGIKYLFVEDYVSRGITMDDMVDMPNWMEAVDAVQQVYHSVQRKEPLPIPLIQQVAKKLFQEVRSRRAIILIPSSGLASNLQPYAHAVNVTLLALMMGKHLGYHDLQLRDLAVGCLLHDIGKTVPGKDHCEAGFDLLRSNREMSLLSSHIAYQHHETIDGEGSPRGIAGDEILPYAQICGVANLYDHMVSQEYIPAHEAVERVMAMNGIKYKEEIIRAFVQSIPPYPPGTKLRLQNGTEMIVTRIESLMQRPIVRMLDSDDELDLADYPTLIIQGLA